MNETIKNTAKQFGFKPEIINKENIKEHMGYVVVGMGGSYLAAGLLKMWKPELDMVGHQDYGLPELPTVELQKRLIILSSYSGNTEEVIDAYKKAGEMGLNRIVISIGGQLLEMAKKDQTAYIQMPDWGIQPRAAWALSLMSFVKAVGEETMLLELGKLQNDLRPDELETAGKELAQRLSCRVPVIYTAGKNKILAYIWKINLNETGKIPAFYNVFPELNHNEMNGFDVAEPTRQLSEKFYFIMLSDPEDQPKIRKRMEITAKLYRDRKLPVEIINLEGSNSFQRIVNSIVLAGFTAYYTATNYGLESEQVPMVEEFKKLV